jgi:hypothetical protein
MVDDINTVYGMAQTLHITQISDDYLDIIFDRRRIQPAPGIGRVIPDFDTS